MAKIKPTDLTLAAIAVFPPALRAAALESKPLRDQLGVTMDAIVQLNEIEVGFKRSSLFSNIRALLAGQSSEIEIVDADENKWTMTFDPSRHRVRIFSAEKQYWLPDFYCLHPSAELRVGWFDKECSRIGLADDQVMRGWRDVLAVREVDDDEVDNILEQFRLAPKHVAEALKHSLRQKNISPHNIIPTNVAYYDRLVGAPSVDDDLKSFLQKAVAKTNSRLAIGTQDLADALLFSSHAFGTQGVSLDTLPPESVLKTYEWLVRSGDRFSQVGAVEWGIKQLNALPQIAPYIESLIRAILADDPNDTSSRLSLLRGLVVLVDGELARSGACRGRQPFWRRLAVIAHVSVLERAILAVNFLPSDFVSWCQESRGLQFYAQTFVDMQREPRWMPDLLTARQLKFELAGRMAAAAPADFSSCYEGSLGKLFDRENDKGIFAQMAFPYSFFPGPLESGFSSIAPMPDEINKVVTEALDTEALSPKSFVPLVNSALIYALDDRFANLAAEGLRRAKHDLPQIKSSDDSFNLLSGLATVAAASRSNGLAEETKILMRVVRRKPDIEILPENALRIGLIAAAAHSDFDAWCKFVGDLVTELSFEDMPQSSVVALYQFLEVLRQLEPALWITTSRADAALRAFHASTPPSAQRK